MINFPDDPRGRELELIIERAKYERWLLREIDRLITREYESVVDTMLSPKFRTLSAFEQRRKLQLFRELERQLLAGYSKLAEFHVEQMTGYAQLESAIAQAQASAILSGGESPVEIRIGSFLTRHSVRSIGALPIQGLRIGDWFEGQAQTMSREARRVIQTGLIEGKPAIEISQQIISTPKDATPQIVRRARNEARSIARTVVNAVQNHGAAAGYEDLTDGVSDEYVLDAVRDSRTTVICRALDGRRFRHDDPKKKVPPFHIGCRTGMRPIVKGFPEKAPTFATFDDWLKTRSPSEQDRILGKQQAVWWRSGKMSLRDAIDADNRVLTLEQLARKIGIAEMAGAA